MKNSREQKQFYSELAAFGFTEEEIEKQVEKDIQAAAKTVRKTFGNTSPMLIRCVLAALNGRYALRGNISQGTYDFQLKHTGDVLQYYPQKYHGRIIGAVYKWLPTYEIEWNEESERERLDDEWCAFLNGKTNDEVRAMLIKVKAVLLPKGEKR